MLAGGGCSARLALAALRAAARCRAALNATRGGGGVCGSAGPAGACCNAGPAAGAAAGGGSGASSNRSASFSTRSASTSTSTSGGGRKPVVAVAMSGGVDSAVAALLVRRAGFEAFGVFMHNWDAGDEAGGGGAGKCRASFQPLLSTFLPCSRDHFCIAPMPYELLHNPNKTTTPRPNPIPNPPNNKGVCTSERDLQDAKAVAARLGLPLLEADFVGRYWSSVFEGLLAGVAAGVTPNPDLTCNAAIKFGALWEFAAAAGAGALATGHYARLGRALPAAVANKGGGGGGDSGGSGGREVCTAPSGARFEVLGPLEPACGGGGGDGGDDKSPPLLLRGADAAKDQSYFLASVASRQLARALFPVGHMTKARVRALAAAEGLKPAAKRSSAGICFIGRRRSFGEFIEQYVPPAPGRFVDAHSGADLGPCANLLALTPGQRAPLGGGADRRYVAGKDLEARAAFIATRGPGDAALRGRSALLLPARWVGGAAPAALAAGEGEGGGGSATDGWRTPGLACSCQVRYRQPAVACTVQAAADPSWRPGESDATAAVSGSPPLFVPSRFAGASLPALAAAVAASDTSSDAPAAGAPRAHPPAPMLRLALAEPARALAPGQAVVLYDGPVVLGSALLVAPGATVAEEAAAEGAQRRRRAAGAGAETGAAAAAAG